MTDKQYCTFESGKEYTLAEIFSGEIRIVIPDLQRDYCWGDKVWDKNGCIALLMECFADCMIVSLRFTPLDCNGCIASLIV